MDKYTASNGVELRLSVDEDLDFKWRGGWVALCGGVVVDALREFFQAERDEQLGRWRWPENPDYVVYRWVADPLRRNVRGVTVLSEAIPRGYTVWEDNVDAIYGTSVNEEARKAARDAARAYFDAHPEPKPWHDAKPHEVWSIQHGMDERYFPFRVEREGGRTKFIYVDGDSWFYADDPQIGGANRIYPPEDES